MPTTSLKCEDDRSIKGNITHSACTCDEQILNLYCIFLCDRLGWCVRHNPIAIIVAGSLLFFPYPKVRGVPNVAERGHSSVTEWKVLLRWLIAYLGLTKFPETRRCSA